MRENINTDDLVDITTICVDKDLPQKERYAEFKRQIRDMHNYKCNEFTVRALYSGDETTVEDCLRGMMA